jgi:hypothetical protein
MPTLIAGFCAFKIGIWWMFFPIFIPFVICLSLHDHNRGVWCSLDALGVSFALLITGHLHWYLWLAYCALNYGVGAILNKNEAGQLIEDTLEGAGLASIVLLI